MMNSYGLTIKKYRIECVQKLMNAATCQRDTFNKTSNSKKWVYGDIYERDQFRKSQKQEKKDLIKNQ